MKASAIWQTVLEHRRAVFSFRKGGSTYAGITIGVILGEGTTRMSIVAVDGTVSPEVLDIPNKFIMSVLASSPEQYALGQGHAPTEYPSNL